MSFGQARRKFLEYLDDFFDSDYFQGEVKHARKKLGIPPGGFSLSKKVKDSIYQDVGFMMFHLPDELKRQGVPMKSVNTALDKAFAKLPIQDTDIRQLFKAYLLYGEKLTEILERGLGVVGLCRVENVKEKINEYSLIAPSDEFVEIVKRNFNDYPVAIKLHPATTQRDLLGFVKENWPIIHYHLRRYGDGAILARRRPRKSTLKKRNTFIYEHRNLPIKEIRGMLAEEDIFLDDGHIGKIISLEKKRRKEV